MVTRGKATDLAYAAGMVDADGYVGICKNSQKPSRHWNPRYQTEVVVTNTYLPMLEWLKANHGGSISIRGRVKDHHKTGYGWKIGDQLAAAFCRAIAPYMRIKREQALLIIEMQEAKLTPRPRGTGVRLPEELLARYESIYQRFLALNDSRHPHRLTERASRAEDVIVRAYGKP
jgi:hypothetical protein